MFSFITKRKTAERKTADGYNLLATIDDLENKQAKETANESAKGSARINQLMTLCYHDLDKKHAEDIAKVILGLACAVFSGKVYYNPSKQFVDNFFEDTHFHRLGMMTFIPGTMLTNMTLNFYFILKLLDRIVKKSIAAQNKFKIDKKPFIQTLLTSLLAALPASSMALLDFMGSEESPTWERSVSLLVNLLIYGGLNLSGSEALVNSLNIFEKNSYQKEHQTLIRILKKRALMIEHAMKNQARYKDNVDRVSFQTQFQNGTTHYILQQLLTNHKLDSEPSIHPSATFSTLTQYLFKPVAVMTLAGYFWITMMGLQKLSHEDLGFSQKQAELFSVALATVAVFLVYGSLMANVVGEVANDLYASSVVLAEKRSLSALLPYALTQQKLTSILLAAMMALGMCSFATSVDLQIEASKAFFAWTGLDQQTGLLHQITSGFSFVFIIITAMITVLFNTFCTPLVANAAATQLNAEDLNQQILNLINNFINELGSLNPEESVALVREYLGSNSNVELFTLLDENFIRPLDGEEFKSSEQQQAFLGKIERAGRPDLSQTKSSQADCLSGLFNTFKKHYKKLTTSVENESLTQDLLSEARACSSDKLA